VIPKIIHYCWLSGDPFPAETGKCLASWRERLPDYEFVLWDAAKFDVRSLPWTAQAFDAGLYAFAADYIRLFAVYHYGGIYMDTDMEALKPFGALLDAPLMLALENTASCGIEAGCFGAEKGHPYIRRCMEYYENRPLFPAKMGKSIMKLPKSMRSSYIDPPLAPEVMRDVLRETPECAGFAPYTPDFFTARNIVTGDIETTCNTRTIHHFAASYNSERWRQMRSLKWAIRRLFPKRRIFTRLLSLLVSLRFRLDEHGLAFTLRYAAEKYITRRIKRH